MFIIKDRDDYGEITKTTKTKERLFKQKLEEKLSYQKLYVDMKKSSEPSIIQKKN